jgi:hypothetical protein
MTKRKELDTAHNAAKSSAGKGGRYAVLNVENRILQKSVKYQ